MKKLFAILLCVAVSAAALTALTACSKQKKETVSEKPETTSAAETEPETQPQALGAWDKAESPAVTKKLRKLFASVDIDGVTFTPVALLETQVVAGTNYRALCKVEPVVENPVSSYTIVSIYEDLNGNVTLLGTRECGVTVPEDTEADGAWAEVSSTEITDEAKKALDKASETLAGATYSPIALLATQVVGGMNYMLFCEVTATVPDAKPNYAIITVYADFNGNAEITETHEFASDDTSYQY